MVFSFSGTRFVLRFSGTRFVSRQSLAASSVYYGQVPRTGGILDVGVHWGGGGAALLRLQQEAHHLKVTGHHRQVEGGAAAVVRQVGPHRCVRQNRAQQLVVALRVSPVSSAGAVSELIGRSYQPIMSRKSAH
eukprot:1195743-Prorocentrum_minimum.AAC.3